MQINGRPISAAFFRWRGTEIIAEPTVDKFYRSNKRAIMRTAFGLLGDEAEDFLHFFMIKFIVKWCGGDTVNVPFVEDEGQKAHFTYLIQRMLWSAYGDFSDPVKQYRQTMIPESVEFAPSEDNDGSERQRKTIETVQPNKSTPLMGAAMLEFHEALQKAMTPEQYAVFNLRSFGFGQEETIEKLGLTRYAYDKAHKSGKEIYAQVFGEHFVGEELESNSEDVSKLFLSK